jgi:hypothetical protein
MTKLMPSLLLLAFTCNFMNMAFAAKPKKNYELDEVNMLIQVSLEGLPFPEQMIKEIPVQSKKSLDSESKAVDLMTGTRWKLKVERIEKNGTKSDITNSPYVTLDVSSQNGHICDEKWLCVWPKEDSKSLNRNARLGLTPLYVGYVEPNVNKVGFNIVMLNILPNPNAPSPTPKPSPSPSAPKDPIGKLLPESAWKDLSALQGIDIKPQAKDSAQLLIFFDPNCPFSASLWARLYGIKDQMRPQHGPVASRWIPVAYMNDTSSAKAAHLLGQNTQSALAQNFETFERKARQGSAPAAPVTPAIKQQLEQNSLALNKMVAGTPLIIYRTAEGKTYLQAGLPGEDKLNALVQQLVPAQLQEFKP